MLHSSEEAVSAKEMRALEINANYLGVTALQLMENAGRAIADEVASRCGRGLKVVVFGGVGRNGGDGMVAARHLASLGFDVKFLLIGHESEIRDESVLRNWRTIKGMGWSVRVENLHDSTLITPQKCDVLIDALLGTGAKGLLREPILRAVKALNESEGFKLAVDVPTGIDADTGEVLGEAVKADLTLTFHKMKAGLRKAKEYAGEVKVVDIGIPLEAELYTGPGDVELALKHRPPESHKGDFGRLLIIGGSETFSGAPALCALAALRSGVDVTYIAAPEKTAYSISAMSPNLITIKLSGEHFAPANLSQIEPVLKKATAVAVGPGLGAHKDTFAAVEKLMDSLERVGKPVLLDADALKAFSAIRRKVKLPLVLTPHAGEFEVLTGRKPSADLKLRVNEVKELSKENGATVLLKGHIDVISDGDRVKLNLTGNPYMTVGGTGDTLSGIVGCFLAQGIDPFYAASAGAFINGRAGDLAVERRGPPLVPTDIIEMIPQAMKY